MVHLSDVHLDLLYDPEAEAECGMPMCCRSSDGVAERIIGGKFGSYRCDLPLEVFEDMLTHIRDNVKPDIVVITGDLAPHNLWSQTDQSVKQATSTTLLKVAEFLGNSS